MITVSLGSSGIVEMRQWFDRAVSVQVDYDNAWHDLRWGLRPRWFGSHEAILALGATALKTGRFDTDVPRKFYDAVTDVESEMNLNPGEHIYWRKDIWPQFQKMYEGYIAQPEADTPGWRTTYAIMAWYAADYKTSRAQLEALNWQPVEANFKNWDWDLTLLPLEVAARTGKAGDIVTRAEDKRDNGDIKAALQSYRDLRGKNDLDSRTREFVGHRVAELERELKLANGEWIDLQPVDDHDPNWVFSVGKAHVLPDGALEVESGPEGHMLYSRVRVGPQFEVTGQFEVVRTSTRSFQAGIVMGLPDTKGALWNSFRVKRNDNQGDIVSFGHGWTTKEASSHTEVNNGTNSFTFILKDQKATATLNGVDVMRGMDQPASLRVRDEEYLLGLGAYNDVNDTVIRYRHMKVRRLGAGQAR